MTTRNKFRSLSAIAIFALSGAAGLVATGCDEGPAEDAGEAIDEAAEDTGRAIDDAVD